MIMIYFASYSRGIDEDCFKICTTSNLEEAKDAIKKDADHLTTKEKIHSIKNQGWYSIAGFKYDKTIGVKIEYYIEQYICDGRGPDFYTEARFVQEKIDSDIELIFDD